MKQKTRNKSHAQQRQNQIYITYNHANLRYLHARVKTQSVTLPQKGLNIPIAEAQGKKKTLNISYENDMVKEEVNKFLKEIQENASTHWKEMNETAQDTKMEIE